MNNDNHLNLHLHDQISGWLRYCSRSVALDWRLGILVRETPRSDVCAFASCRSS